MFNENMTKQERTLALSHMGVGFIAVLIGTLCGVLQVLVRSENIPLPSFLNYYQILTAHGLMLAIVFTTFFIFGFFVSGLVYTMGSFSNAVRKTVWIGFWLMVVGTALVTVLVILNEASVLYTFYAPMMANPWFYVGLALVVIGSWVEGFAMLVHYFGWRKQNPGKTTPLFGFMATTTIILWVVACLGVVATVVFQLIPWSFGWVDTIDVTLSRTLFWYFGHPLVYFWLLPAYMAWYTMMPKIIGGKLFSDHLARFSFILFLLFSIPVGFHHQLMEPGISSFWKFLQTVLTFMVVIPSLMTAFSMFATFEMRGRELGGRGVFGWVKTLPWHDVRFTSLFVAMFFFIPGGAGGLVNASFQMNEVVHNTLWIVGHFHITVGTPVVMTFFGISFWLIPYLSGRTMTATYKKMAGFQVLLWAIGMFLMSTAQHILGLFGAPRRTGYTTYNDNPLAIEWMDKFFASYKTMAVGGSILFIAAMLFLGLMVQAMWYLPKETADARVEFPMIETPNSVPSFLENWKFWIALTFLLILIAYSIPLADMIFSDNPGSPGIRTW
ncbi:MAG: b(o/a)3-type cytochrome-c oxidase subunit 1 [Bacilli bacterium]